jgi:uncharacterized protein
MSPEERQMLADLFERIRANAAAPRDPQADAFINDAVRQQPFAPYILAQTVLVQQHALEGAAQRISELEAQTRASAPAQETSFLGNLGRSLFGGGASPPPQPQRPSGYDASAYQRGAPQAPPSYAPPPPPPGYAPPPQPGPWGAAAAATPAGGGFLSGALRTAAGVAGGVVLGNALENMIGGRGGGLFGGGSALAGGKEGGGETINNYYENAPDAAGQHAEDVLQDQDQDQDDAQDAYDDSGNGGDDGSYDT